MTDFNHWNYDMEVLPRLDLLSTNNDTENVSEDSRPSNHRLSKSANPELKSDETTTRKEKRKRNYTVYSEEQIAALGSEYSRNKFISLERRADLADEISMTQHQIKIWFQNKRQSEKVNRKSLKKKSEILERLSQSTSSTAGPNEIETGTAVDTSYQTFNNLNEHLPSASSHCTNTHPLSTNFSSTWNLNPQNKSEMATTLVRSPSVAGSINYSNHESTPCEPVWIETEEYDFFRDFA